MTEKEIAKKAGEDTEERPASDPDKEWLPMKVECALEGNRLMVWAEEREESAQYSFVLFRDGKEIIRLRYAPENEAYFWLSEPGNYYARGGAISRDGTKRSGGTEPFWFPGRTLQVELKKKRISPAAAIKRLAADLWTNREQMVRLAVYDYRVENKDSRLGKVWDFLYPLIQIMTYWFVFGIGLRSGKPVDGHPYLIWMLCGLIPWFYIHSGIVDGCSCIFSKAKVVLRMRYPLATIPFSCVLQAFFGHIATMAILLAGLLLYGYYPRLEWLNLLYYQLYSIIFLSGLALVTSTLTMRARDYQKLITALIRLLFYATPILWTVDRLPKEAQRLLKLNPVLYVVSGYRDSLLYQRNFWTHPKLMLLFWAAAAALLFLGAWLHYRNRGSFSDMI